MKSRSGTELARLAAALLLTLGGASAEAAETGSARQAIDLAADYLVRVQTDRGFFLYDVNFETGKPSGKSSIVRQAGTAFSLAEYLAINRSAPVKRSVRNALEALWGRSVTYRARRQQLVSGSRSVSKARTGATALALLTETPKPSDEDIDGAMSGNLCRCATYQRIRAAIHETARRMEA